MEAVIGGGRIVIGAIHNTRGGWVVATGSARESARNDRDVGGGRGLGEPPDPGAG